MAGALIFWVKDLSRVGQSKRGQKYLLEEDEVIVTEMIEYTGVFEGLYLKNRQAVQHS